jgi:hypothetical protein
MTETIRVHPLIGKTGSITIQGTHMIQVSQNAFNNAVFAAPPGLLSDSDVIKSVMVGIKASVTATTNIPTGADLTTDFSTNVSNSPKTKKVLDDIQKLHGKTAVGGLTVIFIGEDHTLDKDTDRADDIITAMAAGPYTPGLLVTERGMTYTTSGLPCNVAREDSFSGSFNLGLTPKMRSIVAGGYIFACLASGNQNGSDNVSILYGENHHDILNYIEYFVQHSEFQYVKKRSRTYWIARSNNSSGFKMSAKRH